MLAQLAAIPAVGLGERGEQPGMGLALAAGAPAALARHLQPQAAGEVLDRLHEVHVLVLHEKADGGAVGPAAEAVVELLLGADGEGGRLLGVEGAAGDELAPGLLQRHVVADHVDDVDAGEELVDEVLRDAAGHGVLPASGLLKG